MREYLLLNRQDIEEIREKIEKYEWAKNLFERVKNDTTFQQMSADEVIDGLTANKYMWEEGRFMRDRSLIYALTGDDKDVPQMLAILEERFFTNWEFKNFEPYKHFAIPFDFDHMVDYWMLWLYLANHVHAFMLLKNCGLFDQECVEKYEKVFHRILEAKKKNYSEYLELYNCQFWDLACLGVMGVLLEDDEAVDVAINGHYGFKQMLNKFYDGLFWPEATVYGFHYISSCTIMLAEACVKNGYENLYEYIAPSGASIKAMFDGWIKCMFADGRIATCGQQGHQAAFVSHLEAKSSANLNDSFLFNNEGYRDSNKLEIAYRVYRDPAYAWILSQNPKRDTWDHSLWGHSALAYGVPLEEITPPPAKSELFPQYGAAIVRSDETENYWNSPAIAVYARDGSRQGHSQDDHYNIVLNAFNKNIYPDWFFSWDYRGGTDPKTGEQRHQSPYSGTLFGHNTVVVDGKRTDLRSARILPLERSNEMQILRMISGVDGGAYRGVYQRRTLGVTQEYVVDMFDMRSREQHIYDYVLHSFGSLSAEGLSEYQPHSLQDVRDLHGFHSIDTIAESKDNLWIRPGYKGKSDGDWKATFIDDDTIGSNVFMIGEEGTQVFLTDTPYYVSPNGWDVKPMDDIVRKMPLLIVRREAENTMFVAVHHPFKGKAPVLDVKKEGDNMIISGQGYVDTLNIETMRFKRESIS